MIGVEDDGPAIAAEVAHRLFIPFDRLDAERRSAATGSGLGLALSRGLARALSSASLVHNLPLSVASIAEATEAGGMLTFETSAMKRTFDTAFDAAQAENFWRTPVARTEPWADFLDLLKR